MSKSVIIALFALTIIAGCDNGKQNFPPEIQFIAYCDQILKDPNEMRKYPVAVEKIAMIFENEVKKDPTRFLEFFENTLPSVSKNTPGMAILFEQYATQAVRDEMVRLKQDSNIENLVKKEKQISDLQKTIGQFEKVIEDQKKEIAHLQDSVELKSKKVPVLLVNRWFTTNCLFKIANKKTGDEWEFLLQDTDEGRVSEKEIMLNPGDYTVQFCRQIGIVEGRSMFAVEPETPEHDGMKKHYHAVVESVR